MSVPNTFASATSAIPLANLDADFAYYDAAFQIVGTATSFTGAVTLSTGTANGVTYLNASKVLTSGTALTFDGAALTATSYLLIANSQSYFGDNGSISGGAADGNTTIRYFGGKYLAFKEGSSEQMRLTSTGLGIGTSSPSGKLHTVQSNGINYFESPGISSIALQFVTNGTNRYRIGIPSGSTDLQFLAGGTTETMRLDSAGNLGLGVVPSAWTSTHKAYQLQGGGSVYNNGADGYINVASNSYYNGTNWIYVKTAAASWNIQSAGAHTWWNAPSGTAGTAITFTQAMTLTAAGNLGLGVTPSAWTAFKVLQLTGGGSLAGAANQTELWNNAYYDGASRYYGTGLATRYQLFGGEHRWSTAPSGTAGAAITFTQAMTLDASGNLLVGTTVSPSGTGNIVPAAAKGVNFTGNTGAGGATSQLLNWYEEGTWTPVDGSGAGLTFTSVTGNYTRVGRMVTAICSFTYPTTADATNSVVGGLPFTIKSGSSMSTGVIGFKSGAATAAYIFGLNGTAAFRAVNSAGAAITNAACSAGRFDLQITYFV